MIITQLDHCQLSTTLRYRDKTAVSHVELQTNLRKDFTIMEKGLLLVESAVTFNTRFTTLFKTGVNPL